MGQPSSMGKSRQQELKAGHTWHSQSEEGRGSMQFSAPTYIIWDALHWELARSKLNWVSYIR